MTALVDHGNRPLFTEVFTHEAFNVEGLAIDVLRSAGNLWLSAPAVLAAMGLQPDSASGGYSRRLRRVSHPDIIKITDTPFRFPDGRRNAGSLISPRAVMMFAGGKVQGRNQIKANTFIEWMEETILTRRTPDEWSPAIAVKVQLEPVFRAVSIVTDEDRWGRPLDPLRSSGPYWGCGHLGPLLDGEIDFEGKKLWRNDTPQSEDVANDFADDDGEVIDYHDTF